MSAEATTTDITPSTQPRRFGRWRWVFLGFLVLLIASIIYMLVPASSGTVQVKGQLSPSDAKAIRQEAAHWRHRDVRYSITHFRFGMLWDQIRMLHRCPLVSVASYDGKTGLAVCRGHTLTGNQITTVYMFTNNAGVWSGTTVTRTERKTK